MFVIFSVNFINSQVLVSMFNDHIRYNTGNVDDYDKIIDDKYHTETFSRFGIENRYVFDLDNKTLYYYANNELYTTLKIKSFENKNNLWFILVDDYCVETKERVDSHFVLNLDNENDKYPYFTNFYMNVKTKSIDVYVAKN